MNFFAGTSTARAEQNESRKAKNETHNEMMKLPFLQHFRSRQRRVTKNAKICLEKIDTFIRRKHKNHSKSLIQVMCLFAKTQIHIFRLQIIARPPAYRNQICIWIISIYYLVPIIRMKYVFGL